VRRAEKSYQFKTEGASDRKEVVAPFCPKLDPLSAVYS
jgi:hypothetical protein